MFDTGDTAWVLISTGLVLFMTIGLALFYGGMVRGQHVLSMILQNVLCIGIVTMTWLLIGFSISFSEGGSVVGSLDFIGLREVRDLVTLPGFVGDGALTVPPLAFFHYHMMFAIITPALITGALADRLKIQSWALFVLLWSVLVYAPVSRWVFSPLGWLAERGVFDYAGGIVVHTTAGAGALALLLVVGNRKGWTDELRHMRPNSMPLMLLGTGILWFGWFGFNAGSALSASESAVTALINTQAAGAAGMTTWLYTERFREGRWTSLGGASGAIAGLAAVTPAAGFVDPLSAVAIGGAAGILCCIAAGLKYRFGYDDALDVVGVHLVGGIAGTIMLGLFARNGVNPAIPDGLFFGGGASLLGEQVLGTFVVFAYAFVATFAIAKAIDMTLGMRVSPEQEEQGLDISELLERAYHNDESDRS